MTMKPGRPLARAPRVMESRSYEGRVTEERPPINYSTGSRFNIPEEILKNDPDHVYSFVVYSSANQDMKENFYEAIDRGYQPVPASEHPILARRYQLSPFQRKEEDNVITRGGQILMKCPKETHAFWQAKWDEQTERQNYVQHLYNIQDKRIPHLTQYDLRQTNSLR